MFENKSILTFVYRVQEGHSVLQERHSININTDQTIELPSSAGLCCLPQMGSMSVQTEAGQLHPCYNGPYLTEGLVFSRAKTPFSHGQLGGR